MKSSNPYNWIYFMDNFAPSNDKNDNSDMTIQRNSFPTPIIPPILVKRVIVSMFNFEVNTSMSSVNETNNPYLSVRASNPVFLVMYLK